MGEAGAQDGVNDQVCLSDGGGKGRLVGVFQDGKSRSLRFFECVKGRRARRLGCEIRRGLLGYQGHGIAAICQILGGHPSIAAVVARSSKDNHGAVPRL